MAKRKFQSAAQGRGFKQLGSGLRASEDRIQEQRKREIDSLKLSALQRKEDDQNFISGMDRAFGMEEFQRKERVKLEDKVRTRKYEALKKLAETDVRRLEDEAKMKQKEVDYWKELTPKMAKAAQTSITGIWQFQDTVRGIGEFNALDGAGYLDGLIDGAENADINALLKPVTKDQAKLIREGKYDEVVALSSKLKIRTSHGARLLLGYLKDNKSNLLGEVEAVIQNKMGEGLNEANALGYTEFYIHKVLEQRGIPTTSKYGREIVRLYKGEAINFVSGKRDARKYGEHQILIQEKGKNLLNTNPADPKYALEFHDFINLIQSSYHKDGAKILKPHQHNLTTADAYLIGMKSMIDIGITKINGENHLNEILATLSQPTEGNEKSVPLSEKLPKQTNQIIQYYRAEFAKREKNQVTKIDVDSAKAVEDTKDILREKPWLYEVDGETGAILKGEDNQPIPKKDGVSKEQYVFSYIRKTADRTDINDQAKKDIYEHLGFLNLDASTDNKYILARDLYEKGQFSKATAVINGASATDQKILKPLFEELSVLDKAIVPYQKGNEILTGDKALRTRTNVLFQKTEGGNFGYGRTLHASASGAQFEFNSAVRQKTIELSRKPEYKDNPQGAYEAAWELINTEFAAGADGKTGRFARTTADQEGGGRQIIYNNWQVTADENEVKRIQQLFKLDLTGELKQVANVKTKPFSTADANNILTNNLFSGDNDEADSDRQFLMHPRTVSNARITADAQIAYQHSLPNGDRKPFTIPQTIIEYARLRKKSPTVVYNSILRAKSGMTGVAPEIGLPLSSQDACIDVLNGGSFVHDRNEGAVWAYKACQAQGINPISFNAEDSMNGLSTADSFTQRLDVELTPKSFIENGGLFKTPVNWGTMEELGLGFYWDANSFKAAQKNLELRRKEKRRSDFIDSMVPIPDDPTQPPLQLKRV